MLKNKRALVFMGAGASIDFGGRSTTDLSNSIRERVLACPNLRRCGGDQAYIEIYDVLESYLNDGKNSVNFEHIYHCAHSLISFYLPDNKTVNEYRPILAPFVGNKLKWEKSTLIELVRSIANFIYAEVSESCPKKNKSLKPISDFIEKLRTKYVTRIYTTNYDDFILQVAPNLYTGFSSSVNSSPKKFDSHNFWQETNADSVFHIHGSVHLGFGHPEVNDGPFHELHWFDDRVEALTYASFIGSNISRMDGYGIIPTPIITGLDKLQQIQQRPFSYYFASLAKDSQLADVILVIGSSLGDLHINSWMSEARRRKPTIPLIYVDYWENGFIDFIDIEQFEHNLKLIRMAHVLGMYFINEKRQYNQTKGWVLSNRYKYAIWDKGFREFVQHTDQLGEITSKLQLN